MTAPHPREWIVSPAGVKTWSRAIPGLHRRLARPPLSELKEVRRLGVLRPDGMGDIVLTSGMLRELRRQLPNTRISLICQAQWAPWMRTCPWVDDVIDVRMSSSSALPEPRRLIELSRFMKRTWPLDLEVLIHPGTLYWYVASRALAWFSGAPLRMCWEDPDAGIDTGAALHTHTLPYANGLHETEKCFLMLEAMGLEASGRRLDKWWTAADEQAGSVITDRAKNGRRKLVALGLAASEPRKRWPRERYLEVIRDLADRTDTAFLALGGRDVRDTCRWLSERVPGIVSYAGHDQPLGALWAAIAQCDLYLGNDTGFMHMASAARVPVVVVIGVPEGAPPGTRGDIAQTGPHDTVFRVVRPGFEASDGGRTAIDLVPAGSVTAAVLDLLA